MQEGIAVLSLLEFRDIYYLMLEQAMPEGQLVRLKFSSKNSKIKEKEKSEADFISKEI